MYVAAIKICFDENCFPAKEWNRGAASLCTRLQSRFKVVAKPDQNSSELAILVVTLVQTEQKGDALFDKIIENCESFGLGRVLSEDRVMDQIFHPQPQER
ncbi:MAG: hypothetical protein HRU09_13710 [Oligoflexales bacterium]|nr:hypothetical protein [Oligoflexales bacterium]